MSLDYENSLQAIGLCGNSTSSKEQRDIAEQYLLQFRSRPESWSILVHIFSDSTVEAHTQYIQILAFHVLGDAINNIWNQIDKSAQETSRNLLLNVLAENVDILNSAAFRNKFSAALAGVAERQFPQAWPSFINDMVSLWERGSPFVQEIVIKTFENMLNDCIDQDFNSTMPASRKQDIMLGFKEQLTPLLETSFDFCTVCVQVTSETSSGDPSNKNHALNLLSSIYNMIVPLAISSKTALICTERHDFSYLVTISMAVPELRESALTLLDAMVSQKVPLELLPTFMERIASITIPFDIEDEEENFHFQRCYSKAIYSLVSHNVNELVSDSLIANSSYCDVLLNFIGHLINIIKLPAMLGLNDCLKEWLRILASPSFQRLPVAQAIAKELLVAVLPRTLRMRWNRDADGNYVEAGDEATSLEFDDFESYREFFSTLKSNSTKLFAILAEIFPLVVAESIQENLNSLMKSRSTLESQDFYDPSGQLTKDSSAAIEWSAYITLLEQAMIKLPAHLSDTQVSGVCVYVFGAILEWSPVDAALCQAKIDCLSACAPLMSSSIDFLNKNISSLFGYLNFTDDECRSLGKLSDMAQMVIIKSTEAVVHICRTNKAALLDPSFPMQDMVSEIANCLKMENISAIAVVHMRETLVILSDVFEDRGTKMSLVELALADLLSQFNGNTKYGKSLLDVFVSPTTLIDACQNYQPLLQEGSFTIRSFYNSLKQTSIAKLPASCWTSNVAITMDNLNDLTPITSVWLQVVPLTIPICETIHQFLSPQARQHIHDNCPSLEYMYVPSIYDVKRRAGIESLGFKKASIDPIAFFARNTFEAIRQNLYLFLGQASLHRVLYTSDEYGSRVKQLIINLASCCQYMEHADIITFLRSFAEKYVVNATPGDFSTVAHVMTIIMDSCNQRLQGAWSPEFLRSKDDGAFYIGLYYECNIPSGYADLSEEETDLARISLISDFTSQYSDFLAACVCTKGLLAPKPETKTAATSSRAKIVGEIDKDDGGAVVDNAFDDGDGGGSGDAAGAGVSEDIMSVRRQSLKRLVFVFEPLMVSFVNSVLSLLCVPHMGACRKGIDLSYFLLENVTVEPRVLAAVGQDIFSACLQILFRDDSWSAGLEWDLIDLINSIYCVLLLGMPFNLVTSKANSAMAAAQHAAAISDLPRSVLCQIPHVDVSQIQSLEANISVNHSKKTRRTFWKDFLSTLISANKDPSNISHRSGGSYFDIKVPQILDIRAKVMDTTFNKPAVQESIVEVDLSKLFDESK